MPRELTACEIDSIMVGATFLGAGGGGPLDTGRELLKSKHPVRILSTSIPWTRSPKRNGMQRMARWSPVWVLRKDQGEWYLWSRWSGVL